MSNIRVEEKPESVSFSIIREILRKAHEENVTNGFILRTALLNEKEIEERIGKNGKSFIAYDGERAVGTISVRIINRNCWYYRGDMPDYILAAVLPEYQGRGVNSLLAKKVFDYVKERGFSCIELDTAENNAHAIKVYKHQGFRLVDFRAFKDADHYSVVMVKWFDNSRFNPLYIYIRYLFKKIVIKIRYCPGKKKRFGI